ncbi:MAG TPA: alpha/beta hydrolase-fold protein [Kofleriaceae bacterium]|nr:alpha/beta hydrolase-fold protein [Kofleriaceae bacterium]
MRISPVVIAVVVGVIAGVAGVRSSPAHADPPASPRLAALAAKVAANQRGAEDAFWRQVTDEGTPLVEDIGDARGRLLLTFVYRARPDTRAVAMYNAPGGIYSYARLARLPGTGVFAYSALVDPSARFSYVLAPGDDLGPPGGGLADVNRRDLLFRPDPLNKHPYHARSLVELPKAPPQPLLVPHRDTAPGELVRFQIRSKALNNEREVVVYTPPGWTATGTPYPLVVMFDGAAAILRLGLPIVLDELIATKQIPPLVVMVVDNVDREQELPGNAAFADFVALDLVPWVRRAFHTTADPRRTVVAGISYGGIAASFAAGRHPAVYGNVLSQSGSYWWAPDGDPEGEAHVRAYAGRPRLPVRFWIEIGMFEHGSVKPDYDPVTSSRHMRDVLVARGYDVTYREFVGAHDWACWRGTLGDGLIALLARPPSPSGVPPASPGKAGGIEAGAARPTLLARVPRMAILDGGDATVAWLMRQDPALVTEDEVTEAALAVLELDHAQDALRLLAWNAARFPGSAAVHDSLGDAYWHAGDRARAVASYQRSLAIDPKNDHAKLMADLLR